LRAADLNHVLDKLGPTSRSQALRSFIAFFNWCIRRHYLDVSPCIRFRPDRATARARVLTDAELKSIWLACSEVPGPFGAIVKLLILTGQRRGEIAALQSSWAKDDNITFPKEITKNAREHSIPISPLCTSVLSTFLAAKISTHFSNWSNAKTALDKASGVKDWTLHDIRRTFATGLAELGVAPHVIERLLNHVAGTLSPIALVYNRALVSG
jgi:integrase